MTDSNFDESLVLETLSEHILDKKEIATVTWLSKSQNMPSFTARSCMNKFLSQNSSKVKPTYFVSYFDDGALKMTLSTSEKPSSLSDIELLSKQLYSLQTFEPRELSSLCLPLDDSLNYTKPTIKYPTDNISKNPSDQGLPVPRDATKQQTSKSTDSKMSSAKPITNPSKSKTGKLQSMFGGNNSQSNGPKSTKTSSTSNSKSANQAKKSDSNKPKIGKAFKAMESNPVPVKATKGSPEKIESNEVSKRVADEVTEERSPPKKKQKQSTGKHKRVIMDDSDEEEAVNNCESSTNQKEGLNESNNSAANESDHNNESDKSPAKENQHQNEEDSPKVNKQSAPVNKVRRRRKVLKDVTHVDDEGFLITDKVWQEESCSEDEQDATNNVNNNVTSVNKGSVKLPDMIHKSLPDDVVKPKPKTNKSYGGGGAKKNQGSLFSFFGKK